MMIIGDWCSYNVIEHVWKAPIVQMDKTLGREDFQNVAIVRIKTLIPSISIKCAYIDGFIEELPRHGAVLVRVEDDPLGFPSRGGS